MNAELINYTNNFEWESDPVQSKPFFLNKHKWIFFSLIPVVTTIIAVNLQFSPAFTYTIGKILMLMIPLYFVRLDECKFSIDFKNAFLSAALLCIVPLLFIALGFLNNLDPTPIADKLTSLGLENSFFLVAVFLSLVNAPIEEWFFRMYLLKETKGSDVKKCTINAILFMPHHFAVLILYFPLPYAILFTVGTGLASYAWSWMRLKGASFMSLAISHCICDIVVIYLAGSVLLQNKVL